MAVEQVVTETAVAPPAAVTPKKGRASVKPKTPKAPKAKGEKKVATHPSSAAMVVEAITKLAEKGGSSLQAVKKSIADSHKDVDVVKQSTNIKKALKKLVESGQLVQPKGKGAAGSFKLAVKSKSAKKPKVTKVAASTPKAKKPAAKKTTVKKVAAPKPKKEKAAPKEAKPKSPKKVASPKKTAPATKPKPVKATKPVAKKAAPKPKAAKPVKSVPKAKAPAKPKAPKKTAAKK